MKAAKAHYIDYEFLPSRRDPLRKWVLALLVLAPFAYGALALILGADASWDLRNYHWYNPYAYLTGRHDSGIDFLPAQSQFFLNPWLDVPFYLLATHLPLKLAYFILGTVQGINFPLLFMLAWMTLIIPKTLHKAGACAAIAALGTFSAMGISEIGAVFYDNVTSIGILLSALLVLRHLKYLAEAPEARAAITAALCSLPAGLAVGLKMTCASFCLAECFALLVVTGVTRRGFVVAFAFGCGALLGYAITYGHWGWYLFTQYGSPTFPFFNRVFHAPLMPAVSIGDYFVLGGSAKLLHPFMIAIDPYMANEIWWQDWRIPILYVFLIFAAARTISLSFFGSKKTEERVAAPLPTRFLLWMGAASYFTWISFEAVYRYLLPLDMLAPLLIVICAGLMPFTLRTRWQTAASALIVIAVTIQPGTWGRHHVWPEKMSGISAPALPRGTDTLVLMAGYDAYAYLLPEFPPEVAFLRIQSRTFRPEEKLGINDVIAGKIEAHKGPLKLFMTARDLKTAEAALARFHLALLPKTCTQVQDRLYESHLDRPKEFNNAYPPAYSLCDVRRLPPPGKPKR
ncbi:MAG: hypothetical protein ACAH83_09340 [Alphaproteobacteria bacterium]